MFSLEGMLGILWFIVWLFLAFDDPASHPRISSTEKEYIESAVKNEGKEEASIVFVDHLCPFVNK